MKRSRMASKKLITAIESRYLHNVQRRYPVIALAWISYQTYCLMNLEYYTHRDILVHLFFIAIGLFSVSMQWEGFKFVLLKGLHRILPGYNLRQEEINAFLEVNNINAKAKFEDYGEDAKLVKFKIPKYSELEQWVIDNYSSSRAILRFFAQNCPKSDVFKKGYDASLVKWVQSVPYKRLDDNQKLELLKMNKASSTAYKEIVNLDFEVLFANYTPKEILRLFQSPFAYKKYLRATYNFSIEESLPVVKSMRELIEYMNAFKNLKKSKTSFNFPSPNLDYSGEVGDFKIMRVKNAKDLYHYAEAFKNCAKSYIKKASKGKNFFYIVFKEGKPYIMFDTINTAIREAQLRLNEEVSNEEYALLANYVKDRTVEAMRAARLVEDGDK